MNNLRKKIVPLESEECATFVDWLEWQKRIGNILLFTHVPNETFTRSWKTKLTNKKLGVRKGFPDYAIVTAAYHFVAVEMKRLSGSTTAAEQKAWVAGIDGCGRSSHAKVCRGAAEAIEFVKEFLPAKNLRGF